MLETPALSALRWHAHQLPTLPANIAGGQSRESRGGIVSVSLRAFGSAQDPLRMSQRASLIPRRVRVGRGRRLQLHARRAHIDWHVLEKGVRRMDLGGKALTNQMKTLVSYRCVEDGGV